MNSRKLNFPFVALERHRITKNSLNPAYRHFGDGLNEYLRVFQAVAPGVPVTITTAENESPGLRHFSTILRNVGALPCAAAGHSENPPSSSLHFCPSSINKSCCISYLSYLAQGLRSARIYTLAERIKHSQARQMSVVVTGISRIYQTFSSSMQFLTISIEGFKYGLYKRCAC